MHSLFALQSLYFIGTWPNIRVFFDEEGSCTAGFI